MLIGQEPFRVYFESDTGGGGAPTPSQSTAPAQVAPQSAAQSQVSGEVNTGGNVGPSASASQPGSQDGGTPGSGTGSQSLPPEVQEAVNRRIAAEITKLNREFDQRRQALEQHYASRTPPPEIPNLSEELVWDNDEELAKINEELRATFYENPIKAMADAQRILGERKSAHEAKVQGAWNNYTDYLARTYHDFDSLRPKMLEVIRQFPFLEERNNPASMVKIYQIAKSMATGTQVQPQTQDPMTYLDQPDFMSKAQERLLQDQAFLARVREQVAPQIIAEYVAGKRQAAPPPVMGGGQGGSGPAVPPARPSTWAESRKSAMARLGN